MYCSIIYCRHVTTRRHIPSARRMHLRHTRVSYTCSYNWTLHLLRRRFLLHPTIFRPTSFDIHQPNVCVFLHVKCNVTWWLKLSGCTSWQLYGGFISKQDLSECRERATSYRVGHRQVGLWNQRTCKFSMQKHRWTSYTD